jgi:hypothetical protein
LAPASASRSVQRIEVYCDPASERWTNPWIERPVRCRCQIPISSASRGRSVFMLAEQRHPVISRE